MKKLFFNAGVFCFFLSGTIYVTDNYKSYERVFLLVGIAILFLLSGNHSLIIERTQSFTRKSYLFWIVAVTLSFMVHFESSMLITIAGLLLIYLTSIKWLPSAMERVGSNYYAVLNILLFSQLGFILVSFTSGGLRLIRFEGIFSNPNAFGGVAATFGGTVMAHFLYSMLTGRRRLGVIIFDSVLLVLALGCCFISTSRTSTVALAIAIAVMFFVVIVKIGQTDANTSTRLLEVLFFGIIILLGLYFFTGFGDLANGVINKFIAKRDNVLGGRDYLWQTIIDDFKFFGNGEQTTNSAHSTYFSMLDKYGALGFIGWIAFIMSGLLASMRISFNRSNENPLIYFAFFSYLILAFTGITEVMMLKTAMLLAVGTIPIIKYDIDEVPGSYYFERWEWKYD